MYTISATHKMHILIDNLLSDSQTQAVPLSFPSSSSLAQYFYISAKLQIQVVTKLE